MFLLLNLLGFICALSLLVPSTYVPVFVKWPVAFAVVIFITVLANAKKKDTVYLTKEVKSISVKRGLFHPIMNYTTYSLLFTAFLSVYEIAKVSGITDLVTDYSKVLGLITSLNKLFICALALIVIALLVSSIFKWVLSKSADSTTLKERSFLYVVLTITTSVALVYAALNCDVKGFFDFALAGNNIYVLGGIAGLFILIDFIIWVSAACKRSKANRLDKKAVNKAKAHHVKATKAEKKAQKKAKKYSKAMKDLQNDLDKKQAKLDKKIDKTNKKVQKKNAKLQKKLAKKQAKLQKRLAKRQAKIDKKIAKKNKKVAKKQAKIDKKQAKIDKEAKQLHARVTSELNENSK